MKIDKKTELSIQGLAEHLPNIQWLRNVKYVDRQGNETGSIGTIVAPRVNHARRMEKLYKESKTQEAGFKTIGDYYQAVMTKAKGNGFTESNRTED
jgi:hypothetical protein